MNAPAEPGPQLAAPAQRDDIAQTLYAKGEKIYPREVHGLFAAMRFAAMTLLLGIFYGLPWLQWEGRQAVLLDLPARRFHLFGLTLWPQDLIYLALLLAFAGLTLFLFTAIAGRLWCGYACPQTVWTEIFLMMERLVEGDRPAQMKLDKSPMTAHKLRIKTTKHTLWILFSLFTGLTFTGYFTPIRDLVAQLATLSTGPWETFWILFYGFATYGNAGWMREQVCKYMCPYARFQSAMFDKDTLIVSYDRSRGEPRGSRKAGVDAHAEGLGDCINCTLCVQVCPTGIDIRNGLQYECIGCSACIDVCNGVMERMNYPRGLIRYTTEHALEGRPTRVLRTRVLIYIALWIVLGGLIFAGLMHRGRLDVEVLRDANQLYRETEDGRIENVYTLHIMNRDNQAHHYRITARGLPGLSLHIDARDIEIAAGEEIQVPVSIAVPEDDLDRRSAKVVFTVAAADDASLSYDEEARFLGPQP